MRPKATAQGLQTETDQPSGVPDRDKGGEARGGPMKARTILLGLIAGLGMFMIGESALAQCCAPPPPPCCTPPTPPCCAVPPPPPPSTPPCCTPGHNVNIPGVNVFVAPTVVVNASASARASAGAAGGASTIFYGGGGAAGYYSPPMATGSVALNVEGGRKKRVAYEATRTRRVVIQAVCIDTRQTPHPASQVFAGRDVAEDYEGELYRCLAGTSMQVTWSEYLGKVDFSGGKTIACGKGEALYRARGGKLECRVQKAARDCNERSLLRRFGAGIKILTIVETYMAYREEEESAVYSSTMSLDGGVGGVAY